MKQAQNARNKQRGRSPSRKGGGKPGGPGNSRNEPKVRGNPKQLLEKYKNQAREAKQAGDRVLAEYYYQFADHYQRVLNDVRGPSPQVDYDEDGNEIDGNLDGGQDGGRQQNTRGDNGNRRSNNRGRGRGNGNGRDDDGDENSASRNERSDEGEGRQQQRRGRGGRRPRDGDAQVTDPGNAEQPVEVHPELDLDGTVSPAVEGEAVEKPKRRRAAPATPRKRTPRAKKVEGEGEAPTEASSPEDNAAA
ncbi:DUF4167 domain-containing protein [Kordiimonas aestuarii]|uniref:DUF4167 domain-containing protein n=1 Tax=Kordiimonas aestuarii TaxID=1005925 RepID=UPI0021D2576E|nr:DUF4167 domain-containing protein [Kordiimonas aestuarii]